MDLATVDWLASAEGREAIAEVGRYDADQALAAGTRLRRAGTSPELAAAAMTQARLRERAIDKLGPLGDQLLLTPDLLEQATRARVAARHAERFAQAGCRLVYDLGCGLGSDSLALLAAGLDVEAVDIDPVTAAVAAHNLRVGSSGGPGLVRQGRAEDLQLPADRDGIGIWLDPARRVSGSSGPQGRTRRVAALDQMSPPWQTVQELAGEVPAAGAKLGPGFPAAALPPGAEAQWTSWDGSSVECCVWWGATVRFAGRTAAVPTPLGWLEIGPDGEEDGPAGPPRQSRRPEPTPGGWLFEPDPSVLQAGLAGTVGRQVGARLWDDTGGYLLGEGSTDHPGLRRWLVVQVLPATTAGLRRWVRSGDIGDLTVKKRGVPTTPEQVRRELRPRGSRSATLLLCRVAGKATALQVAQPQPEPTG